MTTITLQLPPDLLDQAQTLAGSPENLSDFLVSAIAHEVQRQRCERTPANQAFWDKLLQARGQMTVER
jgi:predicted transcriptional regulator